MARPDAMAFTDGACSGNPGPGGWGAIIVLPDDQVIELGGPDRETTNNRMEMQAALAVLEHPSTQQCPLKIFTDSSYLIQGITEWIRGWKRRAWQTSTGQPVANQDIWEQLDAAVSARSRTSPVKWEHVRGHQGIAGNERADRIAVAYSKEEGPALYHGELKSYGIDILNTKPNADSTGSTSKSKKSGSKKKAYSYVSLVDGEPRVHRTWPQCEARVKGRSGAKFKKALSPDDERAIFSSWGVAPPR